MPNEYAAGSLDGIRVLDLADDSGACAGRILADLGAEVLLIEPPSGSRLRDLRPLIPGAPAGENSAYHLHHNVNKRSVALDFRTGGGRERFLELVSTADAVIATGGPETVGREAMVAANPAIVVACITPHGPRGEWADRRGTDLTAAATSGLLWVSGEAEGPPVHVGGDLAYKMASLAAATGVLLALAGRDRTGSGAIIDIAVQECARMAIPEVANPNIPSWYRRIPKRPGQARMYRCADDRWVVMNVRPDRFKNFLDWLAEAGVATDLTPDDWVHATYGATIEQFEGVNDLVRELAARYGRDEFVRKALAGEQMCLPVMAIPEMASEPHFIETREFVHVDDGARRLSYDLPRSPVDVFETPVRMRPAPLLGEANVEVFTKARPAAPPREPAPGADPAKPLAGVRVIDFTWVFAGPMATRILANFGAEVIKVESRAKMDSLRIETRPPGSQSENVSATFGQANVNKLSTTIDMSTERGRKLVRRLIEKADIVTNNYRPGVMERLGLGYEQLREINPRIISASIPGCGRTGPWAQIATMGNLIQAASGLNSLGGFEGRPPIGVGTAFPDFITPYMVATTVLAALRQRARTGIGAEINYSQLAGAVAMLGVEYLHYTATGEAPLRRENRDPNYAPHGVYPALGVDEWVALAVEGDAQWRALAAEIGLPPDDPRYVTHDARLKGSAALEDTIAAWTRGHDRWEIAVRLQRLGIAAAPVAHLEDSLTRDPVLSDHFVSVEAPPTDPGVSMLVDGEAIRFEGIDREIRRAPMLGEHNEYVLGEVAGLSAGEIDQFLVEGVIS